MNVIQLVVFLLENEEYAFDIAFVQEIMRIPQQIFRIPNMPSYVEGVVNLRDRAIPVIEIKKIFGYANLSRGSDSRLLIIKPGNTSIGIIVDDVSEVLKIETERIEMLDSKHSNLYSRFISGVWRLDGRMIMLLDASKLEAEILK